MPARRFLSATALTLLGLVAVANVLPGRSDELARVGGSSKGTFLFTVDV
jgi:hypothetical protein